MLVTLSAVLPVLEMVSVRNDDEFAVTFPKTMSPERPMIRVAETLLPLTAIVLVPLVASEAIVILPLSVVAEVGLKVTVIFCEATRQSHRHFSRR